jgi:DNA-repair protein XRCC3
MARMISSELCRRRMKVAFTPHLPECSCEFVIQRDDVFGVKLAKR